ncbi:MAG: glycine-rich protein [Planctomycetota bacterium]
MNKLWSLLRRSSFCYEGWIKIAAFIFIIAFVVAFNYGGCGAGVENPSGSSTSEQSGLSITTNSATNINQTIATLNGTIIPIGVDTFVYFQYGTTMSYGSNTAAQNINLQSGSSTAPINLAVNVTGLSPNTTYNFRIRAIVGNSYSGLVYNGSNQTFTTVGLVPICVTTAATNIAYNSARLNATVNPNGTATTAYFNYGTTTSYGTATTSQAIGNGTSNAAITATAASLVPNTLYNFRVSATNTFGTTYGDNLTFTTPPPPVPICVTNAANNINSNSARLNATVNPNGLATTAYFQCGLSTSYGDNTAAQSLGSGTSAVAITATVTSLSVNRTYNFRISGVNAAGTTYGNNRTFMTGNISGSAPTCMSDDADNITFDSARLNGTVIPNGVATTAWFGYGISATPISYPLSTTAQSIGSGITSVAVSTTANSLVPNALYNFRVVGNSSAGTTYGSNLTFTTILPPTCTTNAADNITYNSARLNGTVNPNGVAATAYFGYGISSTPITYPLSTTARSIGSGTAAVAFSNAVISLTPNTSYNFRMVGTNANGIAYGDNVTFTTAAISPTCITNAATNVNYNSAQLNATVNPNGAETTAYFGYGISTTPITYPLSITAQTTIGNGTSNVAVSANITGLSANSAYNFRISATNSVGTTVGANRIFGTWSETTFTAGTFNNTITTTGAADVQLRQFSSVAAGASHSLGVRSDGTLWAWGLNTNGQIGDGTTGTDRTSPVQIGNVTTWIGVAGGTSHSLGVRSDGTLWAWGLNTNGRLGDGSTTQRNSPVQSSVSVLLPSGTYISAAITPTGVTSWGLLTYTYTAPANTIFSVDVLSSSNNAVLATNVPSGINLSQTYAIFNGITGIKLRVNFSSNWNATPTLSDWGVGWTDDTPPPAPLPPVVVTNVATAISTTSAVLNAIVNPNGATTTAWFGYGINTNPYPLTTTNQSIGSGISDVVVSATISSLTPGIVYNFRCVATNSTGTTNGNNLTFTTLGPPICTTNAATNITYNSATLNGTVNPNGFNVTSCYFDYGTSTSYGSTANAASLPGSGTNPISVTANTGSSGSPVTFNYTGAQQTWTVPSGVTSIVVDVSGAQGGTIGANTGGLGGRTQATLNVTPGNTLYIYVGQQPTTTTGGYNGGGNGYGSYAEAGGGASDIRTVGGAWNLAASRNSRLAVAGGGGGATNSWTTTGGAGGSTNGNGADGYSSNGTSHTGKGATQSAGGAAETAYGTGTAGTLGQGGTGATNNTDDPGGGGGYYGGGGGAAGGAGGGSSWVDGTIGASITYAGGYKSGNGQVIITPTNSLTANTTYNFRVVATSSIGTTNGNNLTFTTSAIPAPNCTTNAATNIASNTVTLNGTVNPNGINVTSSYFQYGTSESYGSQQNVATLPGSGSSPISVTANVSSLTENTLYNFRVVAINAGGTTNGGNLTFTTPVTPPFTIIFNPTSTGRTGTIQNWTVTTTGIYRIEVWGAGGGGPGSSYNQYAPGRGAKMGGDFTLNAGDTLKILVGQRSNTNGSNDGGGGGGTFVTYSNNTPLIIAGGGGGSSYSSAGVDASTGTSGTAGQNGGSGGSGGSGGTSAGYAGPGGGLTGNGGTSPSGGIAGGLSFTNGGTGGATGSSCYGGFGGGGGTHGGGWGGGGGGGYSGGGASTSSQYGGGGGGSYNSGSNQSNWAGAQAGAGLVTITFNPSSTTNVVFSANGTTARTGTIQSWTVPSNGTYRIEVWGAQGGNAGGFNTDYNGGLGARMRGDFTLTAGQTIRILVGQQGVGGRNSQGSSTTNHFAAGGGGGTFVQNQTTSTLLIAAGGGGGGYYYSGYPGTGTNGTTANNGTAGQGGIAGGSSGNGGSYSNCGGSAGYSGNGDTSLSFLNGGTGGTMNTTWGEFYFYGGFGGGGGAGLPSGGGGGYSGGGSGTWNTAGGGGGGGSYNTGTNPSNTAGVQTGDGLVFITRQ